MLEASGDYRLLRRLVPRDEFGITTTAALQQAIVLDTETTGLEPASDQIIELGMLRFEYVPTSGEIVRVTQVYEGLEDPGRPIPPASTAIHGITDDMVAGQRIDDDAVRELLRDVSWVVAHNASFDRQFLERRLPVFETLPWVCSYAEIPWAQEGYPGAGLEYLANQHGFFYEGHRSTIDCRALLEVLRLPLRKSQQIAWHRLLLSGAQQSYRIWALDSPFDSREVLKARGYRWDSARRTWHRTLNREDAAAEAPWLKVHVYGGQNREVEVEVQDALTRYSDRPGRRVMRPL